MMHRVASQVVPAVITAAVIWFLSDPAGASGAIGSWKDRVLAGVAAYGGPFAGWLWTAAGALVAGGIASQTLAMAPVREGLSWNVSLVMPSMPVTLLGFGAGLGIVAASVGLASRSSWWAIALLAGATCWACRWASNILHRIRRVSLHGTV